MLLSVASWNVLATSYVRPDLYGECDPAAIEPTARRSRVVELAAGLDSARTRRPYLLGERPLPANRFSPVRPGAGRGSASRSGALGRRAPAVAGDAVRPRADPRVVRPGHERGQPHGDHGLRSVSAAATWRARLAVSSHLRDELFRQDIEARLAIPRLQVPWTLCRDGAQFPALLVRPRPDDFTPNHTLLRIATVLIQVGRGEVSTLVDEGPLAPPASISTASTIGG